MLRVGKGRVVVVCWTPGALLGQPTLPELKVSIDLCPVDLVIFLLAEQNS